METGRHIFVVSGMPGSGKSTLSRKLAEHFDRAAHIESDCLQGFIVSGAEFGTPQGLNDEAKRQIDLRLHQATILAQSFTQAGFTAIIDDVVTGSRLEQLATTLAPTSFSFVMLLRDLESLKSEWRAMGSPFVDSWDWIDHDIRYATPRKGLWLDTTHLSPDETFALVIERRDEALVS